MATKSSVLRRALFLIGFTGATNSDKHLSVKIIEIYIARYYRVHHYFCTVFKHHLS